MFTKILKQKQTILGVGISAGAIFFVFRNVDYAAMGAAMLNADQAMLVLAVIPIVLSLLFRGFRWKYLMPDNKKVTAVNCFNITAIGYTINNFLPGRVGDIYRGVAIAKQEGLKKTLGITSVFTEKILDSVILIAILFSLSFYFDFPQGLNAGVTSFSWSVAVIILGILLFILLPVDIRSRVISKFPLPASFREVIVSSIETFDRTVKYLFTSESLLRQIPLSFLVWFFAIFYYWVVITAFSLDVPLGAILFLTCVTSIGMAVPSAPGNLGVFHYLAILTLSLYGIPKSEALGVAIVLHGLNYVVITVVGVLIIYLRNIRIKDLEEMAEG